MRARYEICHQGSGDWSGYVVDTSYLRSWYFKKEDVGPTETQAPARWVAHEPTRRSGRERAETKSFFFFLTTQEEDNKAKLVSEKQSKSLW